MLTILHVLIDWLVLDDEQMNKRWPCFILANEQLVGAGSDQPVEILHGWISLDFPNEIGTWGWILNLGARNGHRQILCHTRSTRGVCLSGFSSFPQNGEEKGGNSGNSNKKNCPVFADVYNIQEFDSNVWCVWFESSWSMNDVGEDRNFHEVSTFCDVPWKQVTRVVLSIFSLLYIATGAIYAAEHDVNPQFPDFFTVSLAEGQTQHRIQVTTGNQSQLRVWQFLNAHINDGFGNSSVHAAEWLSHVGWFPLSHITLQFHPFPQPPQPCATCDVYGPCMAA